MEVTLIPKKTIVEIKPTADITVNRQKYEQLRVAAYCRVSTNSEEQLTSYTMQKKVYTELIQEKKEWCLAGIYADEGISGTRAEKREEFQRMINDCYKGKIDYIITKSVSRFARNTADCIDYVRSLKRIGIGVIFEEQNCDTLKCDSELLLTIHAGFAQAESESISKNVTWGKRKSFEQGKVTFCYKTLLGYKKGTDGNPEIIPEEAEIIRNIFDMYLSGMTIRAIAQQMKTENVCSKTGKSSWSASMIQNILKNEKYCGDAILQKTVTIDPISKVIKKNTGEAPMYYVKNNHAAIIERSVFNKVQEELARRTNLKPIDEKNSISGRGKYSKYALTEVLRCKECGTPYQRTTWSRNGKKKVVWRCKNRLGNGTKFCKQSPTIEESLLHDVIVRAINSFNEEEREYFKQVISSSITTAIGTSEIRNEENIIKSQIAQLEKEMMDEIERSVSGGYGIEESEEKFKRISEEITELTSRLEAIEEQIRKCNKQYVREDELNNNLNDFSECAEVYNDSIIRKMIECIWVRDDNKIEVVFAGGYTVEERIAD